jgi:hypothetical protein
LSLSTTKYWGGLLEASLIIIVFAFFSILQICQRRGVNRMRVRLGCSSHATIVKAKAAKAHITVPLLHQSFFIKASNPFFEGLNFHDFLTLESNGGTRGATSSSECVFLSLIW